MDSSTLSFWQTRQRKLVTERLGALLLRAVGQQFGRIAHRERRAMRAGAEQDGGSQLHARLCSSGASDWRTMSSLRPPAQRHRTMPDLSIR